MNCNGCRPSLAPRRLGGCHLLAMLLSLTFLSGLASSARADTELNEAIVKYIESKMGKRVGGGECAHLATEAIRVAGGKFIRNDNKSTDYVWSSKLLSKVSVENGKVVYSDHSARFQPGDVIQYTDAKFSNGGSASHHTSLVAEVDSNGRVKAVYEQNVGKIVKGKKTQIREVVRQPLDLAKLSAGHVKVYRPDPRTPKAGRFEYTVVNNIKEATPVNEKLGKTSTDYTLAPANTATSYHTRMWTTSSKLRVIITVGKTSLSIEDGAGYEVYADDAGQPTIRKLPK